VNTEEHLDFGDLLRRHQNAAGLTREDLAERSGLSVDTISLLERGEHRRPHRYTMQSLADALGLSRSDRSRFEMSARPRRGGGEHFPGRRGARLETFSLRWDVQDPPAARYNGSVDEHASSLLARFARVPNKPEPVFPPSPGRRRRLADRARTAIRQQHQWIATL
jgi:transcriptional regulator with XRE-family HTH domain